jgi:ADP-heptose:LPS heptosyltransferase
MPLLRNIAAETTLQCQAELVPLISSVAKREKVICLDRDEEPPFDCEIELMELPYAFRTTVDTIPNRVPYLSVPGDKHYRGCARSCDSDFRVGLCWSSGEWNRNRTIHLSDFAALGEASGVRFVCLHVGDAVAEIERCREILPFSLIKTRLASISETAATVLSLDLVITVDTMVAHLAGALGRPVWTLLPFCADWRWMVDRDDSPWYPTMRLFRQHSDRQWRPVIEKVAQELRGVVHNASQPGTSDHREVKCSAASLLRK